MTLYILQSQMINTDEIHMFKYWILYTWWLAMHIRNNENQKRENKNLVPIFSIRECLKQNRNHRSVIKMDHFRFPEIFFLPNQQPLQNSQINAIFFSISLFKESICFMYTSFLFIFHVFSIVVEWLEKNSSSDFFILLPQNEKLPFFTTLIFVQQCCCFLLC